MLQGFNIFDFYTDKNFRKWNKADFNEYVPIFKTNSAPAFVVLTSLIEAAGTFKLLNADTENEINSGNIIVSESNGISILSYYGEELADNDDCYCYYEITFGADVYYSDVFGWFTDTSKLIGIKIESSDVTIGFDNIIPFSQYIYEFFLQPIGVNIESETNEDGVEKPYGDIPAFSTTSIIRNVIINGDNQIYRFLSFIRALNVNGSIQVTINGVTKDCYDFSVEVENNEGFGEMMSLLLKYKEFDFISSRNAT